MTSLGRKPPFQFQVICNDGERRKVRFPKGTARKDTVTFQNMVDQMLQSQGFNEPYTDKVRNWYLQLDEKFQKKLKYLKLIDLSSTKGELRKLGGWLDYFCGPEFGHSKPQQNKHRPVVKRLNEFFGEEKLLSEITKNDAKRFQIWLGKGRNDGGGGKKDEGLDPETTLPRHMKYCRQFFKAAVDEELISKNVFDQKAISCTVKAGVQHYVPLAVSNMVRDALPDLYWKTRHELMRHMGCRAPSELNGLRWSEVDWNLEKLVIHSPKTANYKGKEKRPCKIFPAVLPLLKALWEIAPEGQEHILPSVNNKHMRDVYLRTLNNIGETVWPRLFNSLRKSAVTDAHTEYSVPGFVINEWFGHDEEISKQHYRMVTPDHYENFSKVSQEVSQQTQDDAGKEESVGTIVPAGSSIFEQSEARDGRATHLLESKSGPPGTRTRNKRFKRPLL